MNKVIFADRIESAGISGGVVRLNFSVEDAEQIREKGKDPKHNFEVQLVLPLGGFGQSYRLLENLVQQVRAANAAQAPAADAPSSSPAAAGQVDSPSAEEAPSTATASRKRGSALN